MPSGQLLKFPNNRVIGQVTPAQFHWKLGRSDLSNFPGFWIYPAAGRSVLWGNRLRSTYKLYSLTVVRLLIVWHEAPHIWLDRLSSEKIVRYIIRNLYEKIWENKGNETHSYLLKARQRLISISPPLLKLNFPLQKTQRWFLLTFGGWIGKWRNSSFLTLSAATAVPTDWSAELFHRISHWSHFQDLDSQAQNDPRRELSHHTKSLSVSHRHANSKLVLEWSSFTGLGRATCIDLTHDLHDHQCLLRKREEEIVTLAEHPNEANCKLTGMRGKLQQKKQVINEYRLNIRKAQ
jgi:hypothetical protein